MLEAMLVVLSMAILALLYGVYECNKKIKCEGCGIRRKIPNPKSSNFLREIYCPTKGCPYTHFSDGTQEENAPGE